MQFKNLSLTGHISHCRELQSKFNGKVPSRYLVGIYPSLFKAQPSSLRYRTCRFRIQSSPPKEAIDVTRTQWAKFLQKLCNIVTKFYEIWYIYNTSPSLPQGNIWYNRFRTNSFFCLLFVPRAPKQDLKRSNGNVRTSWSAVTDLFLPVDI